MPRPAIAMGTHSDAFTRRDYRVRLLLRSCEVASARSLMLSKCSTESLMDLPPTSGRPVTLLIARPNPPPAPKSASQRQRSCQVVNRHQRAPNMTLGPSDEGRTSARGRRVQRQATSDSRQIRSLSGSERTVISEPDPDHRRQRTRLEHDLKHSRAEPPLTPLTQRLIQASSSHDHHGSTRPRALAARDMCGMGGAYAEVGPYHVPPVIPLPPVASQ
jgi:hypothetical protein